MRHMQSHMDSMRHRGHACVVHSPVGSAVVLFPAWLLALLLQVLWLLTTMQTLLLRHHAPAVLVLLLLLLLA